MRAAASLVSRSASLNSAMIWARRSGFRKAISITARSRFIRSCFVMFSPLSGGFFMPFFGKRTHFGMEKPHFTSKKPGGREDMVF